jgi:hypothetical protein
MKESVFALGSEGGQERLPVSLFGGRIWPDFQFRNVPFTESQKKGWGGKSLHCRCVRRVVDGLRNPFKEVGTNQNRF